MLQDLVMAAVNEALDDGRNRGSRNEQAYRKPGTSSGTAVMKTYAKPLSKLINELSKLPGIGGKTAQRLAFHILSMEEEQAIEPFAGHQLMPESQMKYCSVCGNVPGQDPCSHML